MREIRNKILYSLLGASSGLAGIAGLSRCGQGGCSTCYGCAVAGGGVVLLVVMKKIFQRNIVVANCFRR